MSEKQVVVKSGGIGFVGLLLLLLFYLKLTGQLAWSWWWVIGVPISIPFILFLGFMLLFLGFSALAFILTIILAVFEHIFQKRG